MERVQAAHYDNNHDSAALLRLLINDCINSIKAQVPHTTHSYTQNTHTHSQKKKEKKTSKNKKKRKAAKES